MQRTSKTFSVACHCLIGLLLAIAASPKIHAQTVPPEQVVTIVAPTNGAVYTAPADIPLETKINTNYGDLTNVAYYANSNFIGNGFLVVVDPLPGSNTVTGPVYFFNWTNVPPGNYTLTAVASGPGLGPSFVSQSVQITVVQKGPFPVVRITSPPNYAVFFQPSDIPLFAFAADISPTAAYSSNASVTNVEFYAGTNDLGPAQHVVIAPLNPMLPIVFVLPYDFTLVWSNPPPGQYALTAVASDSNGNSATSPPVNITVVPIKIITNGTPIISIVASDPVAIAGTNCWVWPGLPSATPTWDAWSPAVCVPYTNCGPKDATFTVRRFGDTNDDVTVPYSIGGTASNGVDYVTLPGFVTIPACKKYAFINIVPIEDVLPVAVETVVLTLDASTNTPPDYLLGFPRSAAAIIVDSEKPHPPTAVLPGQFFHLEAAGPDGAWFCVESSPDLVNWTPVATNQVVNGCIDFVDPNCAAAGNNFYQAVPVAVAPLQ